MTGDERGAELDDSAGDSAEDVHEILGETLPLTPQ
jgi:hypothetical protein